MNPEIARERRLRRLAWRLGWRLRKARRDVRANDDGRYSIVHPYFGLIVGGGLSLDEVQWTLETAIRYDPSNDE
jgi:hypothetical protein